MGFSVLMGRHLHVESETRRSCYTCYMKWTMWPALLTMYFHLSLMLPNKFLGFEYIMMVDWTTHFLPRQLTYVLISISKILFNVQWANELPATKSRLFIYAMNFIIIRYYLGVFAHQLPTYCDKCSDNNPRQLTTNWITDTNNRH